MSKGTHTANSTKTSTPARSRASGKLAKAIENDIALRFRPGDRFMTVREVALRYGVSTVTAHRNMRDLAERGILALRPGAGSYVGPAAGNLETRIKVAHIITSGIEAPQPYLGGLVQGIMAALPGVSPQVNVLPSDDVESYLTQVTSGDSSNGARSLGFVLSGVSHEVHRVFVKRELPAVVIGHTEDDVDLPSVDYDQLRMGLDAADFLLAKGYKHIGLLLGRRWYPGDTLFLKGLQQSMAERAIPADRLHVEPVSMEREGGRREIEQVLRNKGRPDALICRREPIAMASLATALQLGLHVPEDVAILGATPTDSQMSQARPAITGFAPEAEKVGQVAGEMLSKRIENKPLGQRRVELPVRLVIREST